MQNKTKQSQKQTVTKYKMKDLSVVELIKANSLLSQNCINLSNHLTKCEMDISSLYHQNLFLKHEIGDIKGVMEVLASKMGMDREMFEKNNEQESKKKIQKEPRGLQFHDDLMTKCPVCKTINHKDAKNCNVCGYKNK